MQNVHNSLTNLKLAEIVCELFCSSDKQAIPATDYVFRCRIRFK